MKTKFTLPILVIFFLIGMAFFSCRKDMPINNGKTDALSEANLSQVDNSIHQILDLKQELAINFESRDKILMGDIYSSSEIRDAVRYQFLTLAEMGMVKKFSHNIEIFNNEALIQPNGVIIIPVVEKVSSTSIAPNSNETTESNFTNKLFFSFIPVNGVWKLSGIDILQPNYPITTGYDKTVVDKFITTESELKELSLTNKDARVLYGERKIITQFFDKKIDGNTLESQLNSFRQANNLLPQGDPMNKQSSLNRTNAAAYAVKYCLSYNSGYKLFLVGHDCANLASQSLKAGGFSYESPYKNGTTSYYVWWYNDNGTTKTSDDNASNTWVGADALCCYLCVNNSYASFKNVSQAFSGQVGLADLIWIPATGQKQHVMMITSIQKVSGVYVIKYSAHTTDSQNATWYKSSTAAFGHFL